MWREATGGGGLELTGDAAPPAFQHKHPRIYIARKEKSQFRHNDRQAEDARIARSPRTHTHTRKHKHCERAGTF